MSISSNKQRDHIAIEPLTMAQVRLLVLVGIIAIVGFIYFDMQLLPESLHHAFLMSRLAIQVPAALGIVLITFLPKLRVYLQTAIMLSLIIIASSNLAFIVHAWEQASVSFPYEGIVLYSYFALFVLRLDFSRALIYSFVVLGSFFIVVGTFPIYGEKNAVNAGFVATTLIVGLFATYHLDAAQAKLTALNRKLSLLSTQDPMTKLLNRRSYLQNFEQLLAHCQRTNASIGVFMIDIDNFKDYNDHYGHLMGDDAITKQAEILKQVFQRDTDILCRYGGEEFVVVTLNSNVQDCENLANAVLKSWETESVSHAKGKAREYLTCSIGVYVDSPDRGCTPESILKIADDALYIAKERGKNRFYRIEP